MKKKYFHYRQKLKLNNDNKENIFSRHINVLFIWEIVVGFWSIFWICTNKNCVYVWVHVWEREVRKREKERKKCMCICTWTVMLFDLIVSYICIIIESKLIWYIPLIFSQNSLIIFIYFILHLPAFSGKHFKFVIWHTGSAKSLCKYTFLFLLSNNILINNILQCHLFTEFQSFECLFCNTTAFQYVFTFLLRIKYIWNCFHVKLWWNTNIVVFYFLFSHFH